MKKFSLMLTLLTTICLSAASNALDAKPGQIVQVTDALQFSSPFAQTSYLELVRVKSVGSSESGETAELEFRLYFTDEDRAAMRNISNLVDQTFVYQGTNLRSLSDIPGVQVIK